MTGIKSLAIKCALFGLAGVLLLGLLYNTMTNTVPGDSREYDAVFSDVSGLRTGDDVRVAGVAVGRVDAIEVTGTRAHIKFTLSDAQAITSTSGLVLRYQNLIGQRYVALVPGKDAGTELAPGATVPLARTSAGFDLTALLNGFRPLFQVLKPGDINDLSESIVKVLQGEGGTISGLLSQTADLTNYLADREQLFQQVAANLTPVLLEISGNGAAMGDTIKQLSLLTGELARDRKTFGNSLDGLGVTVGRTDEMVTELRPDLREDLALLRRVTNMYATNSKAYGESFANFGAVLEALGRATSYRTGVNTLMCAVTLASGDVKIPVGSPLDRHSEVCR